jgi:protein TonB
MVYVRITVDESGRVISAEAVSGHPMLRQATVEAAYKARFAPTRLEGQPVKVSGAISYYFARQ